MPKTAPKIRSVMTKLSAMSVASVDLDRLSTISTRKMPSSGFAQGRFTSEMLHALKIVQEHGPFTQREDLPSHACHHSTTQAPGTCRLAELPDCQAFAPPIRRTSKAFMAYGVRLDCQVQAVVQAPSQHPLLRQSVSRKRKTPAAPGPPPTRPLPALPVPTKSSASRVYREGSHADKRVEG